MPADVFDFSMVFLGREWKGVLVREVIGTPGALGGRPVSVGDHLRINSGR